MALIQTIKVDPQMVKLFQNIPCANDGKQHTDENNNNITNYLEANKDTLSDLVEKNYENLIKALTNNAIATVSATSPTPTLSLPSSSTFPSRLNQSDAYRTGESESYQNGD